MEYQCGHAGIDCHLNIEFTWRHDPVHHYQEMRI
jgi:hypothetical protein